MPNCKWRLGRFHLDTVAGPQGFNPRALAASWCLGWWDPGRSADENTSTINQQSSIIIHHPFSSSSSVIISHESLSSSPTASGNYVCSMTPTDVRERPLTTFSTPLSQLWCPEKSLENPGTCLVFFWSALCSSWGFPYPPSWLASCRLVGGQKVQILEAPKWKPYKIPNWSWCCP